MLGNREKGQKITLSTGRSSIEDIVHDLFRTLGRYHEHQRPDRDKFVSVNWENIQPGTYNHHSETVPLVLHRTMGQKGRVGCKCMGATHGIPWVNPICLTYTIG